VAIRGEARRFDTAQRRKKEGRKKEGEGGKKKRGGGRVRLPLPPLEDRVAALFGQVLVCRVERPC